MPSRFRLSGFFEPMRPTTSKQQRQQQPQEQEQVAAPVKSNTTAATTFQASHGAVFQLDEVVRPRTARSTTAKSLGISRRYSYLDHKQHDSSHNYYINHPSSSGSKLNKNSNSSNSSDNSGSNHRSNSTRTTATSRATTTTHYAFLDDEYHENNNAMSATQHQQQMLLPMQMNHVKNVLAEYCFALDNKQYDKVAKLFAPNCLAFYNAVAPSQDSNKDAGGAQGLRGREAVVAFLKSRVHDKTTIHCLSTQHLEFEYSNTSGNVSGIEHLERVNSGGTTTSAAASGGPRVTACIAKTYFTANTFTMSDWRRPDAPFVHTTQHGQYVDVLRPSNNSNSGGFESGGSNGHGGWEIHHRRLIVMVPRLLQPSILVHGSHEEAEQWIISQKQQAIQARKQQSQNPS